MVRKACENIMSHELFLCSESLGMLINNGLLTCAEGG